MLVLQTMTVLALVVSIILAASTDPAIFWTLILPTSLVLLFTSVLLLRMYISSTKGALHDVHSCIPRH